MATGSVTDERRLRRFLHYASTRGTYFPGSRLHASHYSEENVESLRTVLHTVPAEQIFNIITEVYKTNSSPHSEMIPFVLAECARIEALKLAALKTAEILFDNTRMFLLFFKFAFERTPKIGSGPACKRLIASFYLKKDPIKLAGEVAQFPLYLGWRHKDLVRLGHVKVPPTDIARKAVLTYVAYGPEKMNESHMDNPEAKEVVDYLNKVHNFRKETTPEIAAETIESYMLTIDHINHVHLKSKEVWKALFRQIPLKTLLDHLSLIARNDLFHFGNRWDTDFKACLRDTLQNFQAIKDSGLHPSRVYLELVTYQYEAKFKLRNALLHNRKGEQTKCAPNTSMEIVSYLTQLTKATFKLMKPTKLRYLIAVDPCDMATRKCKYLPYLVPTLAAAITVHCHLKVEPNVTVVAPKADGTMQTLDASSKENVTDLEDMIMNLNLGPLAEDKEKLKRDPTQLMVETFNWVIKSKKKYDVIIMIATSIITAKHVSKFYNYQRVLKVPKSKLIIMNLCGQVSEVDQKNIFVTSGFDNKVLPLIATFIQEAI